MSGSSQAQEAVYVYEAPVRLWHWINALSIVVLCVTGYFIGSPLPTMPGEASDNFLMGYIRFAHFAAAYVLIIGLLGRIYWAFVGNHHARQLFIPPFRLRELKEAWVEIKWYLFMEKEPKKYIGHNPLAALAMFFMFLLVIVFMIFTGLSMYGEGEGMDSWQFQYFTSWINPLFEQSQNVHTFHHLGMWGIIIFVMVHVYAAVREDIVSRQSIVSTMISGWRLFKDDRP